MASWTLWQPLVPRYQLTTKEVTTVDASSRPKSSPASPRRRESSNNRSRQTRSSKAPLRSRPKPEKNDNLNSNGLAPENTNDERGGLQRGKATMYFTMASPIGSKHVDNRGVVIKPSFPVRKSPYIDTFKQQQRINSARQSSEDPSTASPRHKIASPRFRKQRTVSQFPVTQIDQQEMCSYYNDHYSQDKPRPKTAASRTTTKTARFDVSAPESQNRMMCKSAGAARDPKNLSVNTIDLAESSPRPFLKNPIYKDQTSPRRYAVRKLDDATMFIDDDKIIFIKKKTTKNDVLLSQNITEEANYIKHLRRLYLREPKDFAKLVKEPEGKKGNMIRERLEYELKTDHILNYYSRVDDKQDANLWAMAVEESRKSQQTPQTTPRSSSGFRRVESARNRQGHNLSPPRSARSVDKEKERPLSARSLPYSNISSENVHLNHDSLSDWNVFLKFNTRSILHERQFYLQTPTTSVHDLNANTNSNETKESSCDNHECRLCRLEREMGGKPDITTTNGECKDVGNNSTGVSKKVFIETGKQNNFEETQSSDTDKHSKYHVEGSHSAENGEKQSNSKDKETKMRTVSTSTSDLGGADIKERVSETVATNENAQINITNGGAQSIVTVTLPNTSTTGSLKEIDERDANSTKETYSPVISQNVSNGDIQNSMTENAIKGHVNCNDNERGQVDEIS